jgi:hypothetical protein
MAPRKCEVTSRDGQSFNVECDGFTLLDNGFVILKRFVAATATTGEHEKTVALFDRPTAVLLGDEVPLPNTPGLSVAASG